MPPDCDAQKVREAAAVVRAVRCCADSPPPLAVLRVVALRIGESLPSVLRSKDVRHLRSVLGNPETNALFRCFPDAPSVDTLAAAIRLFKNGATTRFVTKAVRAWGPRAADFKNAYDAAWTLGCDVEDADALVPPHNRARGRLTWSVLAALKRGDTLVRVPENNDPDNLGNDLGDDLVRISGNGAVGVTSSAIADVVTRIATAVRERASVRYLDVSATGLPAELTAEQCAAIHTACSASLGVLTGGPGTGKTRCVRALVELIGESRVMLTAPTGRAARNLRGSTVHRARHLKRRPLQETTRADVPADLRLLVVDEASMLTDELMASVLTLAPPRCHVLLVGDPDQLPPIGAGTVLADLLATRACPIGRLEHNHRSNDSVTNIARSILDANVSGVVPALVSANTPGEAMRAAVGLVVEHGAQVLVPHNAARGLYNRALQSARHETRVIMRADGLGVAPGTSGTFRTDADGSSTLTFGTAVLNVRVDEALTMTRPPGETETFTRGDLVMVTKNQNKRTLARGEVSACNGDIGVLTRPPFLGVKPLVEFEDGVAEFPAPTGWLTLGYAATVHKFQGSETDVVVLPLDSTWDRQLLYTAATRARTRVVFLGTAADLIRILRKQRPERTSALRALLM